ncbi:MAG TPA: FAD/NAD(P)-binding oxidoreductase [Pirellulaceae bacterium]|nr:FAD/NAD(P)-binding oxidoreductase [Pirellulaceae bacterium]HMO91510.1 FAD/NAD(P)-binding oxidoreductase [Pirellulaceae bacterium]HMP70983.1 FAD/NAD(P)-binding oxidoreductase [Pirellulaceae bacterium]
MKNQRSEDEGIAHNEEVDDEYEPKLAVVGAGPLGLEAGLYARFLGYQAVLFEQGQVCERLRQFSADTLAEPFARNCSRLGLAAIDAQYPDFDFMPSSQSHSIGEWLDRYLMPLASTDLLADNIRTQSRVLSVECCDRNPVDPKTIEDGEIALRWPNGSLPGVQLLVEANGLRTLQYFDVVIDASGVQTAGQAMNVALPISCEVELARIYSGVFRIGMISPAEQTSCSFSDGLLQIRDLFREITGRHHQDLYATIRFSSQSMDKLVGFV